MSDFGYGAACLGRGFRMLRARPGLYLLGMVPALIVFAVLATALVFFVLNVGDLVAWLTPFADDWADTVRGLARLFLAIALIVAALLLSSALFTGLTLTLGDPFYEHIWRETEAMLGPVQLGEGPGFWASVRDGGKLAVVGLGFSLVVLLSGFLPVVGPALGITLGIALSGKMLARELLGRPLEARGLDAAAQKAMLAPHRKAVLGFGVVTQLWFLVPFGGVLIMPAAVAGATILARELLPADRLLGCVPGKWNP